MTRARVFTQICDCCPPDVQTFATAEHATIYARVMQERGHEARVERWCRDCEAFHDVIDGPACCEECDVCFASLDPRPEGALCEDCERAARDHACDCARGCAKCTGISAWKEL